MVVVWAGWLNRLEEGRLSRSVGGSQSRLVGVGAGVEGREGVGAGVQGGAVGVLGRKLLAGGMLADEAGMVSEADLSETGVAGGTLSLAEGGGAVEAEDGLDFKKGMGVAAAGFLGGAATAAAPPQSFWSSPLSVFFPFLLPLCFSLPLFRSLHPAESLSSPFPLCRASLLPP